MEERYDIASVGRIPGHVGMAGNAGTYLGFTDIHQALDMVKELLLGGALAITIVNTTKEEK